MANGDGAEPGGGAQSPSMDIGKFLGWDAQTSWANQVQVFSSDDHARIVFRETVEIDAEKEDGTSQKTHLAKNVTSIILPPAVAVELAKIMNRVFIDGKSEQSQ